MTPCQSALAGLGQTSPKVRRKEALPDKHDKPLMGLSSGRNFISTNALDVIHAKPKQAEPEFFYTQKQDYGKVPDYLQRAKQLQEEAIEAKALREIETADQASGSSTQSSVLTTVVNAMKLMQLCPTQPFSKQPAWRLMTL